MTAISRAMRVFLRFGAMPVIALALVASTATGAPKSRQDTPANTYGAIAVSKTTGEYAGSQNYSSSAEAESAATKGCRHDDCQIVMSFRNRCGAVALSQAAMGFGQAAFGPLADQGALQACGQHGQLCTVRLSICSTGGAQEVRQGAIAAPYGAIALSESTLHQGGSRNYPTQAEAEAAAIAECGKSDCKTAIWVRNGCGSLAMAPSGIWGSGSGATEAAADQIALSMCQKSDTHCTTRFHICSLGGDKATQHGAPPAIFGAIAVSKFIHRSAVSHDYPSQAEANDAAIKDCGRHDCKVEFEFAGGCAAVATAPDSTMSYGKGPDQASAERGVLELCTKHASKCTLELSICNGNGQ